MNQQYRAEGDNRGGQRGLEAELPAGEIIASGIFG